jgi:hypothetical protein
MCINTKIGTSRNPRSIILGNHDDLLRVDEIAINYIVTGESYDRKATIFDIYFSEQIAKILHNNPDPKSMVECKKCSDWNKWKDAIETKIASLSKGKCFRPYCQHLLVSILLDINEFSSENEMKTTKW